MGLCASIASSRALGTREGTCTTATTLTPAPAFHRSRTYPSSAVLLLNKIDRVSEADRAALRAKHPDAILLSAKSPADVAALRKTIITFFEAAMVEDQIVLPYAKQGLLGDVYENARVLSEDYDTTGRIMKVRGLPGAIARLRRTLAAS